MGDLTGYDMVIAITQNTINANIGFLWELGSIESEINYKKDDDNYMSIVLDQPTVNLVVQEGQHNIDHFSTYLYLPVKSGTIHGKILGTPLDIDLAGWQIYVHVDLEQLASTPGNLKMVKVPEQVHAQVKRYLDDSNYSVSHLLMDFSNVNLGTVGVLNKNDQNAGLAAEAMVSQYVEYLKTSKNPYLLGFQAASNKPSVTNPAVPALAPTTAGFSTTAYIYSGKDDHSKDGFSTFNFNLMVNNDPLPSNQDRGIYDTNFVDGSNESIQGVLVVSNAALKKGYIEQMILPELKQNLGLTEDFSNAGNLWSVDQSTSHTDKHKVTFLKIPVYTTFTRNIQCSVSLSTEGGEPVIELSGYFYQKMYAGTAKEHHHAFEDMWASAKQKWTGKLTLSAGADGKVLIKSAINKDGNPDKKDHKSAVAEISNVITFGQVIDKALHGLEDDLASIDGDEFTSLKNNTAEGFQSIQQQVILPGATTFFFKTLHFNANFDLLMTVSYKN